ncbi:MAG: hypothetical protein COA79_21935 [Planctomycetota bacterium]|nr:MAG: hypothetical protein COA79_21935 [Planctomycetota bacterium]
MNKRTKTIDIEQVIKKNYGRDYNYISGFKNTSSIIKIFHKKCKKDFRINFKSIQSRSSCKHCQRRCTTEEVKLNIKRRMGFEFSYVEGYENSKSRITINHSACNKTFTILYASQLDRAKCPHCNGRFWDDQKLQNYVIKHMGEDFRYENGFKTGDNKIKIKHNTCNHIFDIQIHSINKCNLCPICDIGKLLSPNEFKKKMFKTRGNEYKLLKFECIENGYVVMSKGIHLLHTKCKKVWVTHGDFFYNNSNCSHCSNNAKKTTSIYKNEIKKLIGHEFEVLDEYLNSATPIEHIHNDCGHHFLMSPNNFKTKPRCPIKCEFSDKTNSNWKEQLNPYPIIVKPKIRIRKRPSRKK